MHIDGIRIPILEWEPNKPQFLELSVFLGAEWPAFKFQALLDQRFIFPTFRAPVNPQLPNPELPQGSKASDVRVLGQQL